MPKFLGHLTENSRVMGLLLEKVEGKAASIGDLRQCIQAVQAIHRAGFVHGDVNRYNFIVDQKNATIKLIDFEHTEDFEDELGQQELDSLREELLEESGREGLSGG
jgi:RIO-like serine/threonine protein kinase